MNIKKILLCTAFAATCAAPAFAADTFLNGTQHTWGDLHPHAAPVAPSQTVTTPASPYRYDAPPQTMGDWTGLYGGLVLGGGFGSSNKIVASGAEAGSFDTDGVMGGIELGYNYQYQNYVLGVEGDFTFNSLSGSSTCPVDATATCETDNQWSASLRPRLGYVYGNFLPYATVGLAMADVRAQRYTSGALALDHHNVQFGFIGGGGLEYMFAPHLSAKAEYLYEQFPDATMPAADGIATFKVPFNASVLRVGVNYKFPVK